jgi:hypothetical protein
MPLASQGPWRSEIEGKSSLSPVVPPVLKRFRMSPNNLGREFLADDGPGLALAAFGPVCRLLASVAL